MKKQLEKLDAEVEKILLKLKNYPMIYQMAAHQLNKKGSRLMPKLCLMICEEVCGDYEKAISLAAALELFHNFTLIQDDIIDEDVIRRDQESVWKKWGMQKAIIAGDCLHNLALWKIEDILKNQKTNKKGLYLINAFKNMAIEVFEGECMDIEFENRIDVSVEESIKMTSMKSGAAVAFSAYSAAYIAGSEINIAKEYSNFGRDLGISLQIKNDISDRECIGKDVGSDIRKRKKTLPIVYALNEANGKDKEILLDYYLDNKSKNIKEVISIVDKLKAYQYALTVSAEYKRKAMKNLLEIYNKTNKQSFSKLSHQIQIDFDMSKS